jgi:hypothetical protein
VQQLPDSLRGHLDVEHPPDQIADDLACPQCEVELELPRVAADYPPQQLIRLLVGQLRRTPWDRAHLQALHAAFPVELLPFEERRPTQLQRRHNRLRGQLRVQHPHELRTNVRQLPARKATLLFHVR